jgi:hypothetical protein
MRYSKRCCDERRVTYGRPLRMTGTRGGVRVPLRLTAPDGYAAAGLTPKGRLPSPLSWSGKILRRYTNNIEVAKRPYRREREFVANHNFQHRSHANTTMKPP